jgi:O-antigen ligase
MTLRGALPAACHSVSLAIALCIEHMNSPLAGAWLFFHFLGCGLMVFDGHAYSHRTGLRFHMLMWLLMIAVSTFLLCPVMNGATIMWTLAAMPMLALSMKPQYLKSYLVGFGIVLGVFALGLIAQFALAVDYTAGQSYSWFSTDHKPGERYAAAWPLLDPNNAACVVNMALIPCFWLALNWKRKPKSWDPLDGQPTLDYYLFSQRSLWWIAATIIFLFALIVTGSKAGIACAGIACAALIISRYGVMGAILMLPFTILGGLALPSIALSFANRLPIWHSAGSLLDISPLRGIGLGMFGNYYAQVRTEHYTGGWFAHNDVLQIAIEMGIPAALIFLWQWVEVAAETCRRNIVATCVIGAVLLQAMLEFQFYVTSISLLLGLALAWYDANTEDNFA